MNKLLALADRVEKMNRLLEIAARVEGVTAPDDNVFREAFDACFPKPERVWEDEDRELWSTEYLNYHNLSWQFESFLEVGAYLDAAMTLVQEGQWAEGALGSHIDQRSSLEIHAPCTYDPIGQSTAATPALALVAAALRARAHGGGEG